MDHKTQILLFTNKGKIESVYKHYANEDMNRKKIMGARTASKKFTKFQTAVDKVECLPTMSLSEFSHLVQDAGLYIEEGATADNDMPLEAVRSAFACSQDDIDADDQSEDVVSNRTDNEQMVMSYFFRLGSSVYIIYCCANAESYEQIRAFPNAIMHCLFDRYSQSF